MVLKKKRFLISGIIVFLAIGYLGYIGLMGGLTWNYEVSEFLAQANYGENVRVSGKVAPGSVEEESGGFRLRFTLVDIRGEGSLPVVYHGAVPPAFKVGSEVIVEGHLDSDGIFQAYRLMVKCPSRYVVPM
ncbi:cytochrome c maturation protein CcmE [Dehalococcoidales bacterium]|nr:cytochrome c maturation protein CcmE [Dehalococcoidales bacterium]